MNQESIDLLSLSVSLTWVGLIYGRTSNFGFITAHVYGILYWVRLKVLARRTLYRNTWYHTFRWMPKHFESIPKEPSLLYMLQGRDFSFPSDLSTDQRFGYKPLGAILKSMDRIYHMFSNIFDISLIMDVQIYINLYM